MVLALLLLVVSYGAAAAFPAVATSRAAFSSADLRWWSGAIGVLAIAPLYTIWTSSLASNRLRSDAEQALLGLRRYRRAVSYQYASWIGAALVLCWLFQWPFVVQVELRVPLVVTGVQWIPVLLPYLVICYGAHRVERSSARWSAEPRAVDGLGAYLLVRVRNELLPGVILVWLGTALVSAEVAGYAAWLPAIAVVLVLLVLRKAVLFRWMLGLRSLPDGELKSRLRTLADRWGVAFDDILLWPTGGRVANAAVVGLWPGRGTLLLSDGLLESLSREQLESLVAHEAAHLKRGHGLLRIVAVVLAVLLIVAVHAFCGTLEGTTSPEGLVLTFLFLTTVLAVVSHWSEHDADRCAVELLRRSHDRSDLSSALAKIARLHPRVASVSLLHPSIRRRRRRLRTA